MHTLTLEHDTHAPRVKILGVVPQLNKAIPVWIHRDKNRLHDPNPQFVRQLVGDHPYLDQLGRADVGTMAKPEVQQHERSVKIFIRYWLSVHIHQREWSA